jgi:hypothetical protein
VPPQQPPHYPPPATSATFIRMVSVKAAVFCLLLTLSTHTGRHWSLLQHLHFVRMTVLEAAGTHDCCPSNCTSASLGKGCCCCSQPSALQMLLLAAIMS